MVCILPLILFGILSYTYGKIKSELISTLHIANKGDQIPITINLSNPTIFPMSCIKIYLIYYNSYSSRSYRKEVCLSLDCRTKSSYVINLSSQYAGNLNVTLEGIRFYDYLRIFSLKRKLNKELKIAVLPYYYELSQTDLFSKNTQLVESESYSPIRKGDDPSEVFEIREYREGDRLQRIHWKLSRKQKQLMIKEFSDPVSCSVLLFVNLCMPKDRTALYFMDALLECALSLSYSFSMKGEQHYLAWYDEKHGNCQRIRITQENDLYEAVDGLLQASLYTKESEALAAYLAEYPNEQYTDMLFVTGDLTASWIDSITTVRARSRQVIYLEDTGSSENNMDISQDILQQYGEAGIDLWPVEVGSVLRDMEQVSIG